jgi:hypothetical protein
MSQGLARLRQIRAAKGQQGTRAVSCSTRERVPCHEEETSVLYVAMTEQIPADFHAVDAWLCDHHPALWRRIRALDEELRNLERTAASAERSNLKLAEFVTLCREAQALKEGTWEAVLISSCVFGREVWVVKSEQGLELVQHDSRPVFFLDELPFLVGKTPEQLQDILKAKIVFPGSRIIQ